MLITDDPSGFGLPELLLRVFDEPLGDVPAAMSRQRMSRGAEHFQRLYDADPDPWHFRTSAYE